MKLRPHKFSHIGSVVTPPLPPNFIPPLHLVYPVCQASLPPLFSPLSISILAATATPVPSLYSVYPLRPPSLLPSLPPPPPSPSPILPVPPRSSQSLSLSLCLCISLSLCLFLALFVSLAPPLHLSLPPSLSRSLSLSLSASDVVIFHVSYRPCPDP